MRDWWLLVYSCLFDNVPLFFDRDSLAAERLCDVLEVIFLHELKNSKVPLLSLVVRDGHIRPY